MEDEKLMDCSFCEKKSKASVITKLGMNFEPDEKIYFCMEEHTYQTYWNKPHTGTIKEIDEATIKRIKQSLCDG